MQDFASFIFWCAQGMPKYVPKHSQTKKEERSDVSVSQEEEWTADSDSFHSLANETNLDEEVEEQLGIIKVLLLRAREQNFRIERERRSEERADFCDNVQNEPPLVDIHSRLNVGTKSTAIAPFSEKVQPKGHGGNFLSHWQRLASTLRSRAGRNRHTRSRESDLSFTDVIPSRDALSEDQLSLFSKIRHRRYDEVIAFLAQSNSVSVEWRDEFGNTPLMLAAQTGSKRMCKILLRHGALLNVQNWRGQTVLHFCYAFRYDFLGDYLVSKGADDSITNHYGLTCRQGLEPPRSPTRRHVAFAVALDGGNAPPSGGGDERVAALQEDERTVLVSVEEYQRLRASGTPKSGGVGWVEGGNGESMVRLGAGEYSRLKGEAARAHQLLTPRKHKAPFHPAPMPTKLRLESVNEWSEVDGRASRPSSDTDSSTTTPAAPSRSPRSLASPVTPAASSPTGPALPGAPLTVMVQHAACPPSANTQLAPGVEAEAPPVTSSDVGLGEQQVDTQARADRGPESEEPAETTGDDQGRAHAPTTCADDAAKADDPTAHAPVAAAEAAVAGESGDALVGFLSAGAAHGDDGAAGGGSSPRGSGSARQPLGMERSEGSAMDAEADSGKDRGGSGAGEEGAGGGHDGGGDDGGGAEGGGAEGSLDWFLSRRLRHSSLEPPPASP